MADSPSNLHIAQATQEKFYQYMIALTFTILGLSIQTAHFSVSVIADSLEIVAWVILLVSGLIGLWRWEKAAAVYVGLHFKAEAEQHAMDVDRAMKERNVKEVYIMRQGVTVPAQQSLDDAKERAAKIGEVVSEGNEWQVRRYRPQKFSFVGGLSVLLIARAFVPTVQIIETIRYKMGY